MATLRRSRGLSSHGLDLPLRHDVFRPKSIVEQNEEPYLFTSRDSDRYFLYLPRNLSYCHLCVDIIRQHVQRKVCLLNSKLSEILALPGSFTTTGPADASDSDADNEGGIWLKSAEELKYLELSQPKNILKKTPSRRAKSFPPIRQDDHKKVVHFADSLGLELESIRHVIRSDLPPCIPPRAFLHLQQLQDEQVELIPDFDNPCAMATEFELRLRRQKVRLHSVNVIETTIYGVICVLNLTYHKTVSVRYTVNGWRSYHDIEASYLTPDDTSTLERGSEVDKFAFSIFVDGHDFTTAYNARNKLDFAVRFIAEDGREFWDNNDEMNYSLSPKKWLPSKGDRQSWMHFL